MNMANIILGVAISLIACKYGGFQFDTMYTYISIAIQLYEGYARLKKRYKRRKRKTDDKTTKPDKTIQLVNVRQIK